MKLLFFAPGNSIHTKRWLEYFSRDPGNEVHLCAFVDPSFEIEGVTVHHVQLDTTSKSRLVRLRNSRQALAASISDMRQRFSPDLIHIHSFNPFAYYAATRFNVPLVATPWGSDVILLPEKHLITRLMLQRLPKKADSLICDAAHMKERLVGMGAKPENIHIVFFGTNVEEYHPRNRDAGLPAELGWEPNSLLVVSTRALKPIYDVETLIRAAPAIVSKVPEARFLVVGGGEQLPMLEALSAELAVSRLVRFAGRVSDFDMKRMVASADVYVSTSLSDAGLAASTAEAMASGVPVVVTDFGDNGQWLGKGQAGLCFPAKDSEALASRVTGLLRDPAARTSMGELGRTIICERNNYHLEMGKVAKIYRALID